MGRPGKSSGLNRFPARDLAGLERVVLSYAAREGEANAVRAIQRATSESTRARIALQELAARGGVIQNLVHQALSATDKHAQRVN